MHSWSVGALVFLIAHISGGHGSLAVEDAVRAALANSPRLRAARFQAEATQAQTDRDRPVARPTVTAQAQGTLQGPRVTFPRAGDGDATVLPERYGKLELDVDQPLFHAGMGAARERFGAQTKATEWEEKKAENDLILDVRRAYFQLLTAQEMLQQAQRGVDLARKHRDLARTMLEAGTAMERDVKASDAQLAETEQGVLRAENGAAEARANLNRLLGRDPGAPLEVAPAPPTPSIPDSPDAAVRSALERRPEIRQLEEELRAARAGAFLASTQNQPALSARAVAATQTPSAFVKSDYFAASLVVTWNPFDAGKTRADVREARARALQLEALLEDARLGIRVETEKSWRDMREAAGRLEAAARQVASAESAADVSELRYQARIATQLEVSGALNDVARARAARSQALFDLHAAAAELAHASGADVEDPAR